MNEPPAFTPLLTLRAAAAGERLLRAFTEVRSDLVAALSSLLGNRADAEDAAQEGFLNCWRAGGRLDEVRDLRAWVFRVGLNAGKDLQRTAWRRRARSLAGAETLADAGALSPPEIAISREAVDRVCFALRRLPQEEQEVFLLRQNTGLTYRAIARLRGSPVATVKTQMRAALRKLRRGLGEGRLLPRSTGGLSGPREAVPGTRWPEAYADRRNADGEATARPRTGKAIVRHDRDFPTRFPARRPNVRQPEPDSEVNHGSQGVGCVDRCRGGFPGVRRSG